ncbi:MAG: glycosyltransferase [Planctomycetaceae bacterium]|nr:glycosyltransferase [Planctomycetaceae bacterium]
MSNTELQSKQPLHVLHVVSQFGRGGMEMALARVTRALSGMGIRHSIVAIGTSQDAAELLPPEVPLYCLGAGRRDWRLPLRLWRLICRIGPDVIHARNWGALPDVATARLLTARVPLIFSLHGWSNLTHMPLRRRVAFTLVAATATRLFAVSSELQQVLQERFSWRAASIPVIPNGVDTGLFRPAGSPRSEGGAVIVGTAGGLRAIKNHALLIRSCAALAARGLDIELRIAGKGELQNDLAALAQTLGFAARLTLAGNLEDVPSFLRGLDIFALSSYSEGHPNALLEAMACALPSVATAVGSVREVLEGGRYGRLVPSDDTDAMAAAIASLAGNRELRLRLGQEARQHVCRNYGMERMAAAYAELYRRTAAGAAT